MSKRKKFKDEWQRFVNTIVTRKRSERQYKLPVSYLMSVADSIHKANPSLDIIYNTLTGVYETGFESGYHRNGDDTKWFREKQEKHIADDWNTQKDLVDDLIHNK